MTSRSLATVAVVSLAAVHLLGLPRPVTNDSRPTTNDSRPTTNDEQPTTNDHLSLPRPSFPAVVALMKDPAQALAALERAVAGQKDAPLEALVLRAHLLSDLHRYPESVAVWDEIARRDADLAAFAGRSAIADLLEARDVDEAERRVRAIVGAPPTVVRSPKTRVRSHTPTSDIGPRTSDEDNLLLALADTYQAAGQPARASEIYEGVIGRERQSALADRARLGLAVSEEAAGRLDAALAALHQATITWRLADTFATARSEERRLAGRLHRAATPLTAQQYVAVAARLNAASRFDDAVTLLEEGMRERRLPAGDKVEAAIVENLYRGRQNDAAVSRAARFLTRFSGSPLSPSIRLLQLRLDIRLGHLPDARGRLASLLADKRAPASVRQSAQRLVAANLVATGAARDGLALYRQLLRTPVARRDRFDLYWRAGIAAIRAGEDRTAIEMLRQSRKYAPPRSAPRSTLYWIADATNRLGDAAEARSLWGQLVSENAYDFYGIRSAERIQVAGLPVARPQAAAFSFTHVTDTAAASPEFKTATVLARAGLLDDAASVFHAATARFRTDDGLALLAARAATAARDYATASSIVSTRFSEFLARPADLLPDDVWQMAFPRAYWSEVEGAANRNAVDPLLLLSLMRRESRFVVTARSRTGALGLFQIMPYTAREILPAAQEAGEGESRLDAPASADLAARLVKRIVTRFDGATAPVVAAYNAGDDRVEDWWRASNGVAEDLFVDSIPYGETRQYVREVLANYATYKRLYGAR
jgi:soluble lytic murein transglycosylase